MKTTTMAGAAGRIAGTAARRLQAIDWAEVWAIVIHGLQVLIVITLLAGRATRRAWDNLPVLSERLGRWYSGLLIGKPAQSRQPAQRQARARKGSEGHQQEAGHRHRTVRSRTPQALTGTRRRPAKRVLAG